ncbi:MAG: hypothetical protein LQ341_007655 [Variospora aurantia]|nr:MAG: hypothetical protein LQ341_007655 [Variospora aurantia]
MQYSVIFLAALAATTALAAPTKGSKTDWDNKITPAKAKSDNYINLKVNDSANKITPPKTESADQSNVKLNDSANKNTPAEAKPAGKFNVELSDGAEDGRQQEFTSGQREEQNARDPGPWIMVEVGVGARVEKGDNRCQLFDHDGKALIAVRAGKQTTTFSDDGFGPWTFKETLVGRINCDPELPLFAFDE